jgi:hypothetical protein
MRIENEVREVKPGDAIAIPPGQKHKLWNTGSEVLRLLCCCAPAYEHDDTVITETAIVVPPDETFCSSRPVSSSTIPYMSLLPFGSLPAYQPRRFVPAQLDLGDWTQLAPLFDQLESRCTAAQTVAELESWLLAWGELSAALDEEASRRYIAMSCHTDNADAEKAYLQFVEDIEPQLKPRQFKLEQLFIAHPQRANCLRRDTTCSFATCKTTWNCSARKTWRLKLKRPKSVSNIRNLVAR